MAEKKRVGFLMISSYMDDFEIGKTDTDLKTGDFIDVRGRHYLVVSNSGRSRQYLEIYLVAKDKLPAYMNLCSYEGCYKLANRIRDFIAHPEKFEIKKVHLVR